MAKPFNSLYWDYSHGLSQWYKIIPWNWRLPAIAGWSHWEMIPWLERHKKNPNESQKLWAQWEGLDLSVWTLRYIITTELTPLVFALLSSHSNQQTLPFAHNDQIWMAKRIEGRERLLKVLRPNQRDSDSRVPVWDPRIGILNRHHKIILILVGQDLYLWKTTLYYLLYSHNKYINL